MINYYKIQYAQLCINENPGCEFIATNLDAVTHLTDAQVRREYAMYTLIFPPASLVTVLLPFRELVFCCVSRRQK